MSKFDPPAIDEIVPRRERQTRLAIRASTFQGNARVERWKWSDGEPDRFIANLDGGGLRLPGEPNPVGIGAAPDSLLRAENLAKVIAAARKAAPARRAGHRLRHPPGRVSLPARDRRARADARLRL